LFQTFITLRFGGVRVTLMTSKTLPTVENVELDLIDKPFTKFFGRMNS